MPDTTGQQEALEVKIVASLERISHAFRVLLWMESKEFSLSPIQIQVLIFLLFHSEQKRKVSYLAQEFNMSKATISETVKTLEQKRLVSKAHEPNDNRSHVIQLTEKGQQVAVQTSSFADEIREPIDKLSLADKETLLLSLLGIIRHLNTSGIITIQRMCFNCHFYEANKNGRTHYCGLLNTKLADRELRLDCPEHQLIQTV